MVDLAPQETTQSEVSLQTLTKTTSSDFRVLWQLQKIENEKLRFTLATSEQRTLSAEVREKDAAGYRQRYLDTKLSNVRLRDTLYDAQADLQKLRRATMSTMVSDDDDDELTSDLNKLKSKMATNVEEAQTRLAETQRALSDEENQSQQLQRSLAESESRDAVSASLIREKTDTAFQLSEVLKMEQAERRALRESMTLAEVVAGRSQEKLECLESERVVLLETLQVTEGRLDEEFHKLEDLHVKIDTYGDPEDLCVNLENAERALAMSDAVLRAKETALLEARAEESAMQQKIDETTDCVTHLKVEIDEYSKEKIRDQLNAATRQSELRDNVDILRESVRIQTNRIAELQDKQDFLHSEWHEREMRQKDVQMHLTEEVDTLRHSLSKGDPEELLAANAKLLRYTDALHAENEEQAMECEALRAENAQQARGRESLRAENENQAKERDALRAENEKQAQEQKLLRAKLILSKISVGVTQEERNRWQTLFNQNDSLLKERDSQKAQLKADNATLENAKQLEVANLERERQEFGRRVDLLETENHQLQRTLLAAIDQLMESRDEQCASLARLRSMYSLMEMETESTVKFEDVFRNADLISLNNHDDVETTMKKIWQHEEERDAMDRQTAFLRRRVETLEGIHYTATKMLEEEHKVEAMKTFEVRARFCASLSLKNMPPSDLPMVLVTEGIKPQLLSLRTKARPHLNSTKLLMPAVFNRPTAASAVRVDRSKSPPHGPYSSGIRRFSGRILANPQRVYR
eukprot:GEMP01012862.1.p1 GENE.GEMP01012862.1~~GEMP01012862.1.p1  ORF type:complete len:799 (+),score=187.38 GEMP01012862.1:134-2398(+)